MDSFFQNSKKKFCIWVCLFVFLNSGRKTKSKKRSHLFLSPVAPVLFRSTRTIRCRFRKKGDLCVRNVESFVLLDFLWENVQFLPLLAEIIYVKTFFITLRYFFSFFLNAFQTQHAYGYDLLVCLLLVQRRT